MEQTPQTNPLAGLGKQKLYSLIVATVALITIFLPWFSYRVYGYGGTYNGFRSWGLLSVLGVGAVVAACFMTDKAKDFDANGKKIAMGGFGAIALGALIYFLRLGSLGAGGHAGIGLWLCLAAGLAGLAWVMGFIKLK